MRSFLRVFSSAISHFCSGTQESAPVFSVKIFSIFSQNTLRTTMALFPALCWCALGLLQGIQQIPR